MPVIAFVHLCELNRIYCVSGIGVILYGWLCTLENKNFFGINQQVLNSHGVPNKLGFVIFSMMKYYAYGITDDWIELVLDLGY